MYTKKIELIIILSLSTIYSYGQSVYSFLSKPCFNYAENYKPNIQIYITDSSFHNSTSGIVTYLHEAFHSFHHNDLNYLIDKFYRFQHNGRLDTVWLTDFYPTSECIFSELPLQIQNLDETKLYIRNKMNFANQGGIYGLLEEFNTYYQDAVILDSIHSYIDIQNVDIQFRFNFHLHVLDLEKKCYLFSIYTKTYFNYLKQKFPEIWNELKVNGSTFKFLNKIEQDYFERLEELYKHTQQFDYNSEYSMVHKITERNKLNQELYEQFKRANEFYINTINK